MAENTKTYRIRTKVGDYHDKVINVNLNQSYETLEILSLKLEQKNAYKLYQSDYGVIVGRVYANGGFGVPNAKISVFITASNDANVAERIKYPYTSIESSNNDGVRYNLLPDYVDDDCHQDVGTFPNKRLVLDNDDVIEIFDKYYKYTTVTNNSGDYMLFGVPSGTQQLHVDIDLSDIGMLSQAPRDMVYKGYNLNLFDSPSKFKNSKDLNSLPQIYTQERSVHVYPYWGDTSDSADNIAVTRCDIELSYKFEPTCIFMGSIVTDTGSNAIGKSCKPTDDMGENSSLISGEGSIEMIRKTIDNKVEEFQIKGNRLIDGDGTWCYQIPMNLDYIVTDEFGNIVPSENPEIGIPTRARVRFRISLDSAPNDNTARNRCRYLVPNNPRFNSDDYPSFCDSKTADYEFGSNTKEESYRDLFWNNVYTVKSYIPRLQKHASGRKWDFTGIKLTNHHGDNNPFPYNNMRINLGFVYRLLCLIIKLFVNFVKILNGILTIISILPCILATPFKILCKVKIFGFKPFKFVCPIYKAILSAVPSCVQISSELCNEYVTHAYTFYPGCGKVSGVNMSWISCIKTVTKDRHNKEQKKKAKEDRTEAVFSDGELMNCVQQSLSESNNVVSFNFHNDWVNGVLYAPMWFRKITRKRTYLFGLIKKKAKDQWCSSERSMRKVLRIWQPFSVKRSGTTGKYTNLNGKQRSGRYMRASDGMVAPHAGLSTGLVVTKETILGEKVYYYKSVEVDSDVASSSNSTPAKEYKNSYSVKLLFATDIVLLGSLNNTDLHGVPQFFKSLEASTYKLPSNLLFTDNVVTLEFNGSGDGVKAEEVKLEQSSSTEMIGQDWGNGNDDICRSGQANGGLFYSIGCGSYDVKTKSSINLLRICEFGVSLDETKDIFNSGSVDGGSSEAESYSLLTPDSFISKDEIYADEERSMFATLNGNGLRTKVNAETGLLEYDFKYLLVDNFDNSLREVMESSLKGCNKTPKYNYLMEEFSSGYYQFRMGNDPYFYDGLGSNTGGVNYSLPRFENSFYFYFGLKSGKTAIDKFNSQFFSPCNTNGAIESTIKVFGAANTWCSDGDDKTPDGYIAFDLGPTELPCDILIKAINVSSEDIPDIELNNVNYEKCYISSIEQRSLSEDYVWLKTSEDEGISIKNARYNIIITDNSGNIKTLTLQRLGDELKTYITPIQFEFDDETLKKRFNNNLELASNKDNITGIGSSLTRGIGGTISVTVPINNRTGEKLEFYSITVKTADETLLLDDGSNYVITINKKKNGQGSYMLEIVDGCSGEYCYWLNKVDTDEDYSTFLFGVPFPDVDYEVQVVELCYVCDDGDVCEYEETNNKESVNCFVSKMVPYKLFFNDVIDYDVIKDWSGTYKATVSSKNISVTKPADAELINEREKWIHMSDETKYNWKGSKEFETLDKLILETLVSESNLLKSFTGVSDESGTSVSSAEKAFYVDLMRKLCNDDSDVKYYNDWKESTSGFVKFITETELNNSSFIYHTPLTTDEVPYVDETKVLNAVNSFKNLITADGYLDELMENHKKVFYEIINGSVDLKLSYDVGETFTVSNDGTQFTCSDESPATVKKTYSSGERLPKHTFEVDGSVIFNRRTYNTGESFTTNRDGLSFTENLSSLRSESGELYAAGTTVPQGDYTVIGGNGVVGVDGVEHYSYNTFSAVSDDDDAVTVSKLKDGDTVFELYGTGYELEDGDYFSVGETLVSTGSDSKYGVGSVIGYGNYYVYSGSVIYNEDTIDAGEQFSVGFGETYTIASADATTVVYGNFSNVVDGGNITVSDTGVVLSAETENMGLKRLYYAGDVLADGKYKLNEEDKEIRFGNSVYGYGDVFEVDCKLTVSEDVPFVTAAEDNQNSIVCLHSTVSAEFTKDDTLNVGTYVVCNNEITYTVSYSSGNTFVLDKDIVLVEGSDVPSINFGSYTVLRKTDDDTYYSKIDNNLPVAGTYTVSSAEYDIFDEIYESGRAICDLLSQYQEYKQSFIDSMKKTFQLTCPTEIKTLTFSVEGAVLPAKYFSVYREEESVEGTSYNVLDSNKYTLSNDSQIDGITIPTISHTESERFTNVSEMLYKTGNCKACVAKDHLSTVNKKKKLSYFIGVIDNNGYGRTLPSDLVTESTTAIGKFFGYHIVDKIFTDNIIKWGPFSNAHSFVHDANGVITVGDVEFPGFIFGYLNNGSATYDKTNNKKTYFSEQTNGENTLLFMTERTDDETDYEVEDKMPNVRNLTGAVFTYDNILKVVGNAWNRLDEIYYNKTYTSTDDESYSDASALIIANKSYQVLNLYNEHFGGISLYEALTKKDGVTAAEFSFVFDNFLNFEFIESLYGVYSSNETLKTIVNELIPYILSDIDLFGEADKLPLPSDYDAVQKARINAAIAANTSVADYENFINVTYNGVFENIVDDIETSFDGSIDSSDSRKVIYYKLKPYAYAISQTEDLNYITITEYNSELDITDYNECSLNYDLSSIGVNSDANIDKNTKINDISFSFDGTSDIVKYYLFKYKDSDNPISTEYPLNFITKTEVNIGNDKYAYYKLNDETGYASDKKNFLALDSIEYFNESYRLSDYVKALAYNENYGGDETETEYSEADTVYSTSGAFRVDTSYVNRFFVIAEDSNKCRALSPVYDTTCEVAMVMGIFVEQFKCATGHIGSGSWWCDEEGGIKYAVDVQSYIGNILNSVSMRRGVTTSSSYKHNLNAQYSTYTINYDYRYRRVSDYDWVTRHPSTTLRQKLGYYYGSYGIDEPLENITIKGDDIRFTTTTLPIDYGNSICFTKSNFHELAVDWRDVRHELYIKEDNVKKSDYFEYEYTFSYPNGITVTSNVLDNMFFCYLVKFNFDAGDGSIVGDNYQFKLDNTSEDGAIYSGLWVSNALVDEDNSEKYVQKFDYAMEIPRFVGENGEAVESYTIVTYNGTGTSGNSSDQITVNRFVSGKEVRYILVYSNAYFYVNARLSNDEAKNLTCVGDNYDGGRFQINPKFRTLNSQSGAIISSSKINTEYTNMFKLIFLDESHTVVNQDVYISGDKASTINIKVNYAETNNG